jgi:hypothetical protein
MLKERELRINQSSATQRSEEDTKIGGILAELTTTSGIGRTGFGAAVKATRIYGDMVAGAGQRK